MAVTNAVKFERFFREAGSLDVDKEDLRRYGEFLNHKVGDLLLRGKAAANANSRDIIQPSDLPITKGLQESVNDFKSIDQVVSLEAILEQLTRRPPLDVTYSDETQEKLPEIAGGLGVALARSFPILDEDVKNPQTGHWEKAIQIFNLLL